MITDWKPGSHYKAFVRLGAVTYHPPSKPGGSGRHTATLQDASGMVDVVAWGGELADLEPGFFAVEVTTSEYRGRLQAKIVNDLLGSRTDIRDIQIVMIDGESDGIAQISAALEGREGLDAIHIVSHGSDGIISLGNSSLSSSNLDAYDDALEARLDDHGQSGHSGGRGLSQA